MDKTIQEYRAYLDGNFLTEFVGAESHFSRLWELMICDVLLKSGNLEKNLGDGHPDFVFTHKKSQQKIIFECVCPQIGEKEIEGGDFEYQEDNIDGAISSTSKGIDDHVVSRFSSSLLDKSQKMEKYKKKEEYKAVLLVYGFALGQYKAKKNKSSLYEISVKDEFDTVVKGKPHRFFIVDSGLGKSSSLTTDFSAYSIEKNGKKILVGTEFIKNCKHIDAFVFAEHDIFTISSNCPYYPYSWDEKFSGVLESIFR